MAVTMTPCVVCGMTPTLRLTIRRHVGMIFVQRFVSVNKPLCRTHGRHITKSFLKKTLLEGWWGVISFFINFFNVFSDISVLRKYSRLEEPSAPRVNVVTAAGRTISATPSTQAAAGGSWQADPYRRHQWRWFNGTTWTDDVSDNNVNATDPVGWR
jgi:hypothetical protein